MCPYDCTRPEDQLHWPPNSYTSCFLRSLPWFFNFGMLPSGLGIWHGGRWGQTLARDFFFFPWKGSVGLLLPNWSVLGLEARASKLFHCLCLRGPSILPSALQVSHGGSWDNCQGGKCLIFLKKSSSGSLFSNYAILEPKPGNPSILYGNLGLRFAD